MPVSAILAFQERELERWRRLLPASTVVPVPGAGHFVQSDAPEAVAAAIRSSYAERQVSS